MPESSDKSDKIVTKQGAFLGFVAYFILVLIIIIILL